MSQSRLSEHEGDKRSRDDGDAAVGLLAKEVVDVALIGVVAHYDCTKDQAYRLLAAAMRKVEA